MLKLEHLYPSKGRYREFKANAIEAVLVHRINLGTAPSDVLHAFEGGIPEAAKVTGYKMPYHFLVDVAGTVTQCVSASHQAPHARKYNPKSLAVGMMGDFTRHHPSVAQWNTGALLVALLTAPLGWQIMGHDEAPGGSSNSRKQCPGKFWNMDKFRAAVFGISYLTKDVDDLWAQIRK